MSLAGAALTRVGFGDAAPIVDQPTGISVGAALILGAGAFALGAFAGYLIRDSVKPSRASEEAEEEEY